MIEKEELFSAQEAQNYADIQCKKFNTVENFNHDIKVIKNTIKQEILSKKERTYGVDIPISALKCTLDYLMNYLNEKGYDVQSHDETLAIGW